MRRNYAASVEIHSAHVTAFRKPGLFPFCSSNRYGTIEII